MIHICGKIEEWVLWAWLILSQNVRLDKHFTFSG